MTFFGHFRRCVALWALCIAASAGPSAPRFQVEVDPSLASEGLKGRLVLVAAKNRKTEPRLQVDGPSWAGPVLIGMDFTNGSGGLPAVVPPHAETFPIASLDPWPAELRWVQAVLMTNRDLRLLNAPGNLYSEPVSLEPADGASQNPVLRLTRQLPADTLPPDSDYVRHVRFQSEALTQFYGRPMYLRASVVLPKAFAAEPTRRFPLVVDIGGFGARYDRFDGGFDKGGRMREAWEAFDMPQMILLALDGAGPAGDPYQINSDNHGPYGDALVQELIPKIEHEFRGIGQPWARFTTGGSTGGWVSLALQVFYPDYFGGCWSGFPDGVDFRAFQLVDIYTHTNAFVNESGNERPSARKLNGDVDFTMRFEVAMENVLGDRGSYANGGGQWGSWNATYGPRAKDGRAVPLWDARTGAIDRPVADSWKRYDLRLLMADNWATLGPKLRGKLHVWVGEADEYFLNNAVHLLDDFLKTANPPADAKIQFGPGKGHGWNPQSFSERLKEMQRAVEANAAKPDENARDAYFRNRFMHGAACPHCKGGR